MVWLNQQSGNTIKVEFGGCVASFSQRINVLFQSSLRRYLPRCLKEGSSVLSRVKLLVGGSIQTLRGSMGGINLALLACLRLPELAAD